MHVHLLVVAGLQLHLFDVNFLQKCVQVHLYDHLLDLLRSETALVVGDGDLLLLASALLLGRHVQDAVGVDVEGHLDLRHAARGRRDAGQVEGPEQVVVLGHGALALVHLDVHARLVVRVRREDLALLGRDRRVALDEPGEHAAERLDAERERGDVEQQHVLDFALEHAALHAGAGDDERYAGAETVEVALAVREARGAVVAAHGDGQHTVRAP